MKHNVVKSVDLHGVICPMNFVKTKLALENLNPGELLEVLLDDGESITNVPRSVKEEGHKIIKVEPVEDRFRLVIEKGWT